MRLAGKRICEENLTLEIFEKRIVEILQKILIEKIV
jgi:hypothetical protein